MFSSRATTFFVNFSDKLCKCFISICLMVTFPLDLDFPLLLFTVNNTHEKKQFYFPNTKEKDIITPTSVNCAVPYLLSPFAFLIESQSVFISLLATRVVEILSK